MAQGQWVRLFEKELLVVRQASDNCVSALASADARLEALERDNATSGDIDELAELLAGELQTLRDEMQSLTAGAASASEADSPQHAGVKPLKFKRGQDTAARLKKAEEFVESAKPRLEAVERELGVGQAKGRARTAIKEGDPEEGALGKRSFASRLGQIEGDVRTAMEPLRKHAVSLRALEETTAKVEELQQSLKALPSDLEFGPKLGAQNATASIGQISVLDAYRLQAMVEQAMAAMEALVRQRSDDVAMINGYLRDVYARLDGDLLDSHGNRVSSIAEIHAELSSLVSRVHGLTEVHMKELQDRVGRESAAAQEVAGRCAEQIGELRDTMRRVVEQSADSHIRLKSLANLADTRGTSAAWSEGLTTNLMQEIAQLRIEVASAQGGGPVHSVEAQTQVMQLRTEFDARLAHQHQESLTSVDVLSRQLRELQSLHYAGGAAGGGGADTRQELARLGHDIADLRGQAQRLEVEAKERSTRGERELRAEIRAVQRLVLEVGDLAGRPPILPPTIASPIKSSAQDPHERSVGDLVSIAGGVLEWRLPGIRQMLHQGDRRALVSRPISVGQVLGKSNLQDANLRLKFFPLGSRKRTLEGFCSLYMSGQEGLRLQFFLRVGTAVHGPMECFFDRPDKITGRHDFCKLADQLEGDGTVVIQLVIESVVHKGAVSR